MNLADAVKGGTFRKDFYYRLNSFHLIVPPLRERREDILPLVRHFLAHFSKKYNKKNPIILSQDAEKAMVSYAWPGNIREMKNCVERLIVLGIEGEILASHLPHHWAAERKVRSCLRDGNLYCLTQAFPWMIWSGISSFRRWTRPTATRRRPRSS